MPNVLEVKDLVKQYDIFITVKGITFDIKERDDQKSYPEPN